MHPDREIFLPFGLALHVLHRASLPNLIELQLYPETLGNCKGKVIMKLKLEGKADCSIVPPVELVIREKVNV